MPLCTRKSLSNRLAARGRPNAKGIAMLAIGMAALVLALGASTSAAAPIEGIWTFNGGKVGIQSQGEGKFVGTVVEPTKFSQCYHPTGEKMWTGMAPQPGGSYWGFHQWYFATEACVLNPTLGLAAWRVLQTSSGARFLRVCLSEPGSSSQPMIGPEGTATDDTYGCVDSALVSALPGITPTEVSHDLQLPSGGPCVKHSTMRIRLHDPKNDPIEKVVVRLRGGKIHRTAKVKRHGSTVTATLNLTGLSSDKFTVSVRVTTVLGDHLSRKRIFHGCSKILLPPHLHLPHG